MSIARRLLHGPDLAAAAAPPPPASLDSNVAVILAALLCALICVVGLALVGRCAWFRRGAGVGAGGAPPRPPNKGVKKKVLRSLPKLSFDQELKISADCPICLAEFVEGEEIRILPQCGHAFHAGCVDTWLGSRSSCPSCRRVLVAEKSGGGDRCQRCGASPGEDGRGNGFLP